jgi:hypothetical protein
MIPTTRRSIAARRGMLGAKQEDVMSERALAFVEGWVTDHVHPEGSEPEGDITRAKRLAEECLLAANAEGIPKAEIDQVVEDLTAFMAGQIEEVTDREGGREVENDRS